MPAPDFEMCYWRIPLCTSNDKTATNSPQINVSFGCESANLFCINSKNHLSIKRNHLVIGNDLRNHLSKIQQKGLGQSGEQWMFFTSFIDINKALGHNLNWENVHDTQVNGERCFLTDTQQKQFPCALGRFSSHFWIGLKYHCYTSVPSGQLGSTQGCVFGDLSISNLLVPIRFWIENDTGEVRIENDQEDYSRAESTGWGSRLGNTEWNSVLT